MQLVGKTILIISPEPWGTNFLSKHHYAAHLAKRNNQIFFLNPPSKKSNSPELTALPNIENLFQIDYSPILSGTNRMQVWLKNLFQRIDAFRILKVLPQKKIDIVWSFDPYRFQNLKSFNAEVSIFHPVDLFDTALEFEVANRADLIVSVSHEILAKYKSHKHKYFINHGLSDVFLGRKLEKKKYDKIRCGYVGNLRSYGLDLSVINKVITQNPEIEFHFIGPNSDSNLGGKANKELNILLASSKNVVVYGSLSPERVAEVISSFDLFLICYSENIQKIASNSHKILEYLSTGKVVVSSWIATYETMPSHLFEMTKKNDDLPILFKEVISNLEFYNAEYLQNLRIAYAQDNSYEKQITRIEKLIEIVKSKSSD